MDKYTELSDFEINLLVAQFVLPETQYDVIKQTMDIIQFLVDGSFGYRFFDPCNNPTDAMPIVKDNLISITHDGIAWDVSCAKYPKLSVWNGLENYNDNFYRKAMELFLLIKDAENEKV
ncbi:phage protein NinX family protein [Proteus terrae]|uniref:phage protein NinX family protein n=1 Tax=Proteus terrae TaxID=1574161 RepID=UPI0032DB5A6A